MWIMGTENRVDEACGECGLRPRPRRDRLLAGVVSVALLGVGVVGCSPRVKVEAPDKPIEININVKIEQEVRIKLDKAVEQTLEDNPELFGVEDLQ